jgi:hypothetical protein
MSLKTGREEGGSRVPFLVVFGSFGADQREARRGPILVLVFPSEEGFGFCLYTPHQGMHLIADQREARTAKDHAVFLCWKLRSSLRLALCIARAASVSDWLWAK